MSTNRHKPLHIQHDEKRDVVIIEGVAFACDFFRTISNPVLNVIYEIFRDDDGIISIRSSQRNTMTIRRSAII